MIKGNVILVSAGSGDRCALEYNKVFYSPLIISPEGYLEKDYTFFETSVLGRSILACCTADHVKKVIIVAAEHDLGFIRLFAEYFSAKTNKRIEVTAGGNSRTRSVYCGLTMIDDDCDVVAIHDGARPYVTPETVAALIKSAAENQTAVFSTAQTDSVYDISGGEALERRSLKTVATPQCFSRKLITEAYAKTTTDESFPDDASLVLAKTGVRPRFLTFYERNTKITYAYHLAEFDEYIAAKYAIFNTRTRIFMMANTYAGIGYDVHRLVKGRPLMLCGINVPHEYGLLGHSDADAALHALADALLSAVGERDIGYHFPDNDDRYLNMAGKTLIAKVLKSVADKGYVPASCAITVISDAPKLSPFIPSMKETVAKLLNVAPEHVGVAATTGEGLGITDGKRAIAAIATANVKRIGE